jgi:hypothetical protein
VRLNKVQGNDYPYFYGVVVARGDFGLEGRSASTRAGAVKGRRRTASRIVMQQATTKTSGTTRPRDRGPLRRLLGLARRAAAACSAPDSNGNN